MEIELNKCYFIDCLDQVRGLPSLPDKFCDVVFFDPVYNANKDYGVYKDNLPLLEYIKKMMQVVYESERISKKGIGVYVDNWRFELWWKVIFPNSKPIIIWKRSPGFSDDKNILASFHAILTNIKSNKQIIGLWSDLHPVADGYYWRLTGDYVSKDHPAQTSLEIVKRFIENFSQKGNLVVDPYIGTGSTAQACIELQRKWMGYEINPDYEIYIKERLKTCKKDSIQFNLKKYVGMEDSS